MKFILLACLAGVSPLANAQSEKVNVFLGSSGDHGQMSPDASYPFSMMDICPQTYPKGHTGYEYKAKTVLGFTHNRFEGVGCEGSGGNILITPYSDNSGLLIKQKESGSPGFYSITFRNGISAAFAVLGKSGIEQYHFKNKKNGFVIDLSHTLANGFVAEEHLTNASSISGWIESDTTCNAGVYRVYYYISFDLPVIISKDEGHIVNVTTGNDNLILRIAFSSFSVESAKADISKLSFDEMRLRSTATWNKVLSQIRISGDPTEEKLFYSELYRVLQSPYDISEPGQQKLYNGWSVWDNYKTQLPLLSITYPNQYKDIINSLAGLYKNGKKTGRRTTSRRIRLELNIRSLFYWMLIAKVMLLILIQFWIH